MSVVLDMPTIGQRWQDPTTAEWVRKITMAVEEQGMELETLRLERDDIDRFRPFLAEITGNTAIAGATNRFSYEWTEIQVDDVTAVTMTKKTWQRSGGVGSNPAYNLAEMMNNATVEAGVDVTLSDYTDANYNLIPIGGGGTDQTHQVNVPVEIRLVFANSLPVYVFDRQNSHDGSC